MCGRYFLDPDSSEEIAKIIQQVQAKNMEVKTGEIFPSNSIPILIDDLGQVEAETAVWGFPGFKKSQLIINARSETVQEKKMFAKPFQESRCVVPTTGFYEWNQDKEKFLFKLPNSPTLFLAGIYKSYQDETRSVILTTAANESMADVHNRMPILLSPTQIEPWLTDLEFADQILKEPVKKLIRSSKQ